MMDGGALLQTFAEEVEQALEAAKAAGDAHAPLELFAQQLSEAGGELASTTMTLAQRGMSGDREGMMAHSTDYLELFSLIATSWLWLRMATAAARALPAPGRDEMLRGKLACARYWFATELPRAKLLAELIRSGEDSYQTVRAAELG